MIRISLTLAALLAAVAPATAQDRMGAEVSCAQVGATMVYDCVLMLKRAAERPV